MRPTLRRSPRLRLVAAWEQQSGTVALAPQKAVASAIGPIFSDGSSRGSDSDGGTSCPPERRRKWTLRLAYETRGDKRCVVDVVYGQRHDLGDRAVAISNDDLFVSPNFPQVLRVSIPELDNVGTTH
jgi:hypothetical protein